MKTKRIIIFGTLAVLFFIIGFSQYSNFLDFFLPKSANISYSYSELSGQFVGSLKFGLVWAIVPIMLFLISSKIVGIRSWLISIFSTLSIISISIFVRYIMIKFNLSQSLLDVPAVFNIQNNNFSFSILIGVILSFLILMIVFGRKQ